MVNERGVTSVRRNVFSAQVNYFLAVGTESGQYFCKLIKAVYLAPVITDHLL
jgi:hypothetical protein